MQKTKIFTIALISTLGIILTPTIVNAETADMYMEVFPTSWKESYKITKTKIGKQKVKVVNAYTAMTDPCPNCKFNFMAYRDGYGKTEGMLTLKMDQTGTFPGDTAFPTGKYYLTVKRADVTALPTMVNFHWIYQ